MAAWSRSSTQPLGIAASYKTPTHSTAAVPTSEALQVPWPASAQQAEWLFPQARYCSTKKWHWQRLTAESWSSLGPNSRQTDGTLEEPAQLPAINTANRSFYPFHLKSKSRPCQDFSDCAEGSLDLKILKLWGKYISETWRSLCSNPHLCFPIV